MARVVAVLFLLVAAVPAATAADSFYLSGHGGVPLAVTAQGPKEGPEILLIHGLGHGRGSYSFQFESDVLEGYRLVAFDMRGHGQSGKPWTEDGYNDPAIWAGDVQAVMDATDLKRPVIVGWSYGGFLASDYTRVAGPDHVAGIVMVNTLGGLVNAVPAAGGEGAEDMAEAYRLLASPTFASQSRAIDLIAPYLIAQPVDPAWQAKVHVLGMMLPPYVRPLLAKHPKANTDLAAGLDVPLLVIHGVKDTSLQTKFVEDLLAVVPNGRSIAFEESGHTPFAEEPARFNQDLKTFVDAVWSKP